MNPKMKPEDIVDLNSLCDYIEENVDRIFVRDNTVEANGKWGSYALTELKPEIAIHHALRFVKESRIPVVYKGDKDDGD